MHQLSSDLTQYLHEAETCAALVRIEQRKQEPSAPGIDEGVIQCRIEDVVHGKFGSNSISVPYTRKVDPVLRAKSSLNHWNVLELKQGDLLLLVLKTNEGNAPWEALSGVQVASKEDVAIAGLTICYYIKELAKDSDEQQGSLNAGVVSATPLVRNYVLDAMRRHDIVSREIGSSVLAKALDENKKLDREIVLRIADSITSVPFFDEEQKVDSVNKQVISTLATAIERLESIDDRKTCLRYLASCALADFDSDEAVDRDTRKKLLHVIGDSPSKPIAETIESMAKSEDTDDQEIAADILSAWKD